jgi:hypothetical protein
MTGRISARVALVSAFDIVPSGVSTPDRTSCSSSPESPASPGSPRKLIQQYHLHVDWQRPESMRQFIIHCFIFLYILKQEQATDLSGKANSLYTNATDGLLWHKKFPNHQSGINSQLANLAIFFQQAIMPTLASCPVSGDEQSDTVNKELNQQSFSQSLEQLFDRKNSISLDIAIREFNLYLQDNSGQISNEKLTLAIMQSWFNASITNPTSAQTNKRSQRYLAKLKNLLATTSAANTRLQEKHNHQSVEATLYTIGFPELAKRAGQLRQTFDDLEPKNANMTAQKLDAYFNCKAWKCDITYTATTMAVMSYGFTVLTWSSAKNTSSSIPLSPEAIFLAFGLCSILVNTVLVPLAIGPAIYHLRNGKYNKKNTNLLSSIIAAIPYFVAMCEGLRPHGIAPDEGENIVKYILSIITIALVYLFRVVMIALANYKQQNTEMQSTNLGALAAFGTYALLTAGKVDECLDVFGVQDNEKARTFVRIMALTTIHPMINLCKMWVLTVPQIKNYKFSAIATAFVVAIFSILTGLAGVIRADNTSNPSFDPYTPNTYFNNTPAQTHLKYLQLITVSIVITLFNAKAIYLLCTRTIGAWKIHKAFTNAFDTSSPTTPTWITEESELNAPLLSPAADTSPTTDLTSKMANLGRMLGTFPIDSVELQCYLFSLIAALEAKGAPTQVIYSAWLAALEARFNITSAPDRRKELITCMDEIHRHVPASTTSPERPQAVRAEQVSVDINVDGKNAPNQTGTAQSSSMLCR